MIGISVYRISSKKRLTISIGIGILLIFALSLLLPTLNPLFIWLPSILFLIILSIIESRGKPESTVFLTERQIIIYTEQADIKLDLAGISKLKLRYSGFKGKRLPLYFIKPFDRFSGSDNYIYNDLGTKVYEYRLLMEDEIKENQVIEFWGYGVSGK